GAARPAGADQPERGHGHLADERPDAAVHQLRRLVADRQLRRDRHPAQHLAPALAAPHAGAGGGEGVVWSGSARRGVLGVSGGPVLFLAGGGSGGHVFPLLAVAERLQRAVPNLELVFIGTERGLETRLVPAAGYKLELMSALPFRGVGIVGASRSLL